MFYQETDRAYQITEIYHVVRQPISSTYVKGRDFSALAYRIHGNTRFRCQNQEMNAATGSVTYIPAFTDYQISYGQEELIILHLRCFGKDGEIIEIHDDGESIAVLFEELLRKWDAAEVGYQQGCMAVLYRIFEALQQAKSNPIGADCKEILPAVHYLRENFRDPTLRIPDLAQMCHISEVYFRKLYKKAFGISPMEALLDMRFRYARSLLRSGYYSVKQVAEMSGFTDTKYFRTAFGKRYSMTPSDYAASAQPPEGE